jgi:hypothetical protein
MAKVKIRKWVDRGDEQELRDSEFRWGVGKEIWKALSTVEVQGWDVLKGKWCHCHQIHYQMKGRLQKHRFLIKHLFFFLGICLSVCPSVISRQDSFIDFLPSVRFLTSVFISYCLTSWHLLASLKLFYFVSWLIDFLLR